ELPYLEGFGVPERSVRQVSGVDLDQSNIGGRVGADHLPDERPSVLEVHLNFGGVVDDMVVGHDYPIRVYYDARSLPLDRDEAEPIITSELRAVDADDALAQFLDGAGDL